MGNSNKRNKINNLKLEEIFELVGNMLSGTDIIYFCNDEKVVDAYLDLYDYRHNNLKEIQEFLIENEEKIDKEKLVFAIYLNYKNNLGIINDKIDRLSSNISENTEELYRYITQQELQSKFMKKAEGLLKDSDVYILKVRLENDRLYSDLYSSREMTQNRRRSESRNLERIKQIDEDLSADGNGSIYLLQVLILSDLKFILPDEQSGIELRECILNNAVYNKGEYDVRQLNNIKDLDHNKYAEIIDGIEPDYFLPELRKEIIRNIRFVDMDKMLLLIAYRFEEYLEEVDDSELKTGMLKEFVEYVKSKIKDKDIGFDEELEKRVTYEPIQVKYTYKDLEKFSRRIIGDSYIKKSEIEKTRQALKTGEVTLDEIEGPLCGLLDLEDNDFEEIMHYSDENFVYAVELLNLEQEQILSKFRQYTNSVSMAVIGYLYESKKINLQEIIDLYSEELISAEFFKEFSADIDVSEELNLPKIHEQYLFVKKQKEQNQEEINKLDKMIELYKLSNLEEKTSEELEELSDKVMYEIAENFEDENDILFYYGKGLVTLRTVAEWSGANTIEKLYNEEKITFEDIENLDINSDIKQSILEKVIMEKAESYSQEELLEYINKGYLSEDNILKIYETLPMNEVYAEDMFNKGIISVPIYIQIINRGKEILEEQADISFGNLLAMGSRNFSLNLVEDEMEESNIAIGDVPVSKKKNEQADEDTSKISRYNFTMRTSETLIDPNVRWEFLKALKCKFPRDKDINNQDPNNPFYNYEFYVIENDSDEAEKDSIVIAERFFKDRYSEDEYATSNATYIWQYKDYLIAQRMLTSEQKKNKKAVLQETEGVVYVANHRPGSWVVSLLYKIAQAKAGKSFEEYRNTDKGANKVLEQLEKLYTHEELIRILELAKIIDDEQMVTTPKGKKVGIVYDVIKDNGRIEARKKNNHGQGSYGDDGER